MIYLSIGANLGDREAMIRKALEALENAGIRVVKKSSLYETEPFGLKDQPWFLNTVVEIETKLEPEKLLNQCLKIENLLGRERTQKWGPRTIDIDLLLYGDSIISTPTLTIPHIGLPNRRFVLEPLAEIAPDTTHPTLKKEVRELLKECADESIVRPHDAARTQNQSHGTPN